MSRAKKLLKTNEEVNYRKLAKEISYDVDRVDFKDLLKYLATLPDSLATDLGCDEDDAAEVLKDRIVSVLQDEFGLAQDLESLESPDEEE